MSCHSIFRCNVPRWRPCWLEVCWWHFLLRSPSWPFHSVSHLVPSVCIKEKRKIITFACLHNNSHSVVHCENMLNPKNLLVHQDHSEECTVNIVDSGVAASKCQMITCDNQRFFFNAYALCIKTFSLNCEFLGQVLAKLEWHVAFLSIQFVPWGNSYVTQ